MATVYRCDICKDEKENRGGFLINVTIPLASRYTRVIDAENLDRKDYDICVECARKLNEFIESIRKEPHAR